MPFPVFSFTFFPLYISYRFPPTSYLLHHTPAFKAEDSGFLLLVLLAIVPRAEGPPSANGSGVHFYADPAQLEWTQNQMIVETS